MIRSPRRRLPVAVAAVLLAASCGDDGARGTGPTSPGAAPSARGPALAGSITVFAAASLTDAFEEVAAEFEAAHPGTTVAFGFGSSSALREQILSGAPADVFASASTPNMDQVVEAGAATEAVTFVQNRLQIAVPAGNPAGVTGLADFADEDLLIGLCAEQVPCGQFARAALANAGVTAAVDTNEPDVRALLTKIEAGELDAGIVYVTDVLVAGDAVEGIELPAAHDVVATYPIAVLTGAPNRKVAEAFVAFVLAAEGQEILASYGFDIP